jgi:hypothetical protein
VFIFHIGREESSGADDPVPDPATATASLGRGVPVPDWGFLPTREGDAGL